MKTDRFLWPCFVDAAGVRWKRSVEARVTVSMPLIGNFSEFYSVRAMGYFAGINQEFCGNIF